MSFLFRDKTAMPEPADALPGRDTRPFDVPDTHFVLGTPLEPPFPDRVETAIFGMGCFWGAERGFWQTPGVYTTAAGYAGGFTLNPTYEEVCSGRTGHDEVVLVAYRPEEVSYDELLRVFWEGHDPTQGMRQGNDVGTQYRSAILVGSDAEREAAEHSRLVFAERLGSAGYGEITTEIAPLSDFYYAEDYHQQYLAKNPNGYCGLGGTGVSCPIGLGVQQA
jgi:peptide-methionine (S)-S-oxide reductase